MAQDSQVDEPSWVPASDALERAAGHCGDRVAAKTQLADLLKDGRLRAHADRLWISKRTSLTAAWRSRSKSKFDADVSVPRMTWERSRFWTDDLGLWRWSRNRFVLTASQTPPERIILEGIKFHEEDLAREFPLTDVRVRSRRGRGGRPIKREEWHIFWKGALELAQRRELNEGCFSSQAELLETLREYVTPRDRADPLLSDDAMKPQIRYLWDTYITCDPNLTD